MPFKTIVPSEVFFNKMVGDYCRYLAEIMEGEQKQNASQKAEDMYSKAIVAATDKMNGLHETDPLRLGLMLNYSVFHYEVLNTPDQACTWARRAFEEAVAQIDNVREDHAREAKLIMYIFSKLIQMKVKGTEVSSILKLNNVSKAFGGIKAVTNVSFSIKEGEIVGLIGPNGAGKTTLVNLITGVHKLSTGNMTFLGKDITRYKPYMSARIGLARTFQVVQPFPEMTVFENVLAGALFGSAGGSYREAAALTTKELDFVGLSEFGDAPASALTLPNRKKLELAKSLAMAPKILFLDEVIFEPTLYKSCCIILSKHLYKIHPTKVKGCLSFISLE